MQNGKRRSQRRELVQIDSGRTILNFITCITLQSRYADA
jgi:hypothetical protein